MRNILLRALEHEPDAPRLLLFIHHQELAHGFATEPDQRGRGLDGVVFMSAEERIAHLDAVPDKMTPACA